MSLSRQAQPLIKDASIIFTHCYSTTVVQILKTAWEEGKRFTVYTTETRPLHLGRRTALALAEIDIPVEHYLDLDAERALKNANLFLFGCHAIGPNHELVVKTGTNLYLLAAQQYGIPAYACSAKEKRDPKLDLKAEEIDARDPKQVWEDSPSGILIHNPGYEIADKSRVTGWVTENGIEKF